MQVHTSMQQKQGMAKVILVRVGLDSATPNSYNGSDFSDQNPMVLINHNKHK